ncbi:MAG: DUF6165 family protein [Calditrichaceae bacterium]
MKIEVSIGEVVDKVSILSIKLEKIKNPEKLKNIEKEFNLLYEALKTTGITRESKPFIELVNVNRTLWEIEDKIRIKEAKKEFDEDFIKLARSVYFENDKRADIKKQINVEYG